MIIREAMQEIESHEFAARLNVASDFRTFIQAAKSQEAVLTLWQELDSPEKCQQVLYRVFELSRQRVDPRYENPWDTALAVYVWLISSKDLDLARMAAEVAAQAPQCWWATKISRHILLEEQAYSGAGSEQHELSPVLPIPAKVTQNPDAGEAILFAGFTLNIAKTTIVKLRSTMHISIPTDFSITARWLPEPSRYEMISQCVESSTESEARWMG
jgi:hypothetical protein